MNKIHIVSQNLKTDWSINFPIKKTCNPTSICKKECYAKYGRLAMPASLSRQEQVYQLFKKEDPLQLAHAIGNGYRRKGLSFLRWCGNGDMFKESIAVLTATAANYKDTIHWVVTRKPSVVKQIYPFENIYLMFSLDGSQDSLNRKKKVDLLKHTRLYYSFLREEANQDTLGASIIFNLQKKKGTLPFDNKRTCPVDAGKLPVQGACKMCRKCFSEKVYE